MKSYCYLDRNWRLVHRHSIANHDSSKRFLERFQQTVNNDSKKNLSEEDKDMIVNVISLVIQNIISKNQSLKGFQMKIPRLRRNYWSKDIKYESKKWRTKKPCRNKMKKMKESETQGT